MIHFTTDASREAYTRINSISSMQMVVGLHAPRGTGKDTTANGVLDRILGNRQCEILSYALPLYEALSALTGLPVPWLQDQANKNRPLTAQDTPIVSLHGKTVRSFLELLGTDLVRDRMAPDHFVQLMHQRLATMTGGKIVFITDVRFQNEAAQCDVVIELRRPGDQGYSDDHVSQRRLPEACISGTYTLTPGDTSLAALVEFTNWLSAKLEQRVKQGHQFPSNTALKGLTK